MPIEVTMPKFGLTMHEGTIQRYFKAIGDNVKAGEPLYEVETEKVLYEVEAPASGILARWVHEEGAVVECGGLVALIAASGEDVAAVAAADGQERQREALPLLLHPKLSLGSVGASEGAPTDPNDTGGASAGARRPISPVARKLAAELGVELARVAGSGPGGRITREDVERAAQPRAPHPPASTANGTGTQDAAAGERRGGFCRRAAHLRQTPRCAVCRCAECARRSRPGCIRACAIPPSSPSAPRPT